MPNAQMAQRVLQRITSRVEPLMRRYKWKVGALEEFFPMTRLSKVRLNFASCEQYTNTFTLLYTQD